MPGPQHNKIDIPPSEFPHPEDCAGATAFLNKDHPSLVECVNHLRIPELSPTQRAIRLFDFVRDKITYEFLAKLTRKEYEASYILQVGRGFCTQKAVLLAALGRAAGIPSALIMTDLRDESLSDRAFRAMGGTNLFPYHGIVAFHLNGHWRKMDATLSPDVVKRKRYRPVEFDGHDDALLAPQTLEGKPHVRYERIRGAYADLPFEEMTRTFHDMFKKIDMEALQAMRYKL